MIYDAKVKSSGAAFLHRLIFNTKIPQYYLVAGNIEEL